MQDPTGGAGVASPAGRLSLISVLTFFGHYYLKIYIDPGSVGMTKLFTTLSLVNPARAGSLGQRWKPTRELFPDPRRLPQ